MRRTALALFGSLALLFGFAASVGAQNLNCGNFDFQEDAQAVYNADTSDPNGLDGPIGPDNDTQGTPDLACEKLPSRGTSGGTSDPTAPVTDDTGSDDTASEDGAVAELPATGSGTASEASIVTASLMGASALALAGAAMFVRRMDAGRA